MLELCTGSRLHFGLLELAADQPNRFGGLGLMLDKPQLLVQVGPSEIAASCEQSQLANQAATAATAEIKRRVQLAIAHTAAALGRELAADIGLRVIECPALHSGLGCGTQLATAVSTAVQLALSMVCVADGNAATKSKQWQPIARLEGANSSHDNVARLAALSGRGKRSAIGLHGFLYGGLVQDLGYSHSSVSGEPATPSSRPVSTRSCPLPPSWRIVIITSDHSGDMFGSKEERLIDRAGATANARRSEMLELSDRCMSAAASNSFFEFTRSLDSYMQLAGALFAAVQAGPYRDEPTAARVRLARAAGLSAVGQSSWGPTVFGFAESQAVAERAANVLSNQLEHNSAQLLITRAANHGALWRAVPSGVQHAS